MDGFLSFFYAARGVAPATATINRDTREARRRIGKARAGIFLLIFSALPLAAQQPVQSPPPPPPVMDAEKTRLRIKQVETPGRRAELKTLKGTVLFAGPGVRTNRPVPLVVHFHGAPWLVEFHVARKLPRAALITVNLGAGSRAYGGPFEKPETFQSILDEAGKALGLGRGWSSVTLVGFSAGYGAVRAILRRSENFSRVNNVLLLDGIHAGYSPAAGKPPAAERGAINAADLDSFVEFARAAAAGKKTFVIAHSEISPGTYASTTECADYLLAALGLERRPDARQGPAGMRQLSAADARGFRVRGYAGDTAPDHVDYLHAMPAWLGLLKIK